MLSGLKKASAGLAPKGGTGGAKGGGVVSARRGGGGAFSAEVLDGRKVRALLGKGEKEFDAFLSKYFDMLDKDSGGTLDREEMKPALIRFGSLLGLPSPGTAADADNLVDRLFTTLMADDLGKEIDRATFINISKNFLTSVASNLEEHPLVVHVYDGAVLQELAENEELFDAMVDDFFNQFDADSSGALSRDEILPAMVSLGLVPPAGAKPEADALLSRILGKYGGAELELNRKDFKLMMRDVLKEVSDEFEARPMVVGLEFLPVMTAPVLRSVTKDPKRLHSLADVVFEHWDTLKMGRLAKSDVMKGFKEVCQSYNVPILDDEQAEAMCLSACMFMNADADATGFVERGEFDSLLAEILVQLAVRLENDPSAAAAASTQTSQSWLSDWFRADSTTSGGSEPPPATSGPASRSGSGLSESALSAASSKVSSGRASSSASSPSAVSKGDSKGGSKGGSARARTAADIKAAYNYRPSDAVLQARERAELRQKKVEEVADSAERLEADAANFEDLSAQLAEKMKKRWW